MQRFLPGASIHYQGAFHTISDPFREPLLSLSGLFAPVGSLVDKLRVALLRTQLLLTAVDEILSTPPKPLDAHLKLASFSDRFINTFFRPFYQGIFLAPLSEQSSTMFSFVFRMFAEAPASLPAAGIGAITQQMRNALGDAVDVKLNTRVIEIGDGNVTTDSGTITAPIIIVATEGPEAVRILGGDITTTDSRGSICLYFTSETAPRTRPMLTLNGDGDIDGPVNNMFIPNTVASSYAPKGKTLISTTIVGDELGKSDAELEASVRQQMKGWFGSDVDKWSLLRIYRIPHSQSAQNPDYIFEKDVMLGEGLFVCGDHRNSPTLNGAILSGRQAAEKALAYSRKLSGITTSG